MVSRELLIWTLTGAETTTCRILARTSATLIDAPAGLMPMRLLAELGRTNMSMPMPFWRVLKPLSLPIRMAVMERIMMTSMAMARQLMSERRGRWTRLPTTSLFIQVLVYGNGRESRIARSDQKNAAGLGLRGYGRGQPVGNTANRGAAANCDAFRADEEGTNDGHEIGSHDRSKDDTKYGVAQGIDNLGDAAFRGQVTEGDDGK